MLKLDQVAQACPAVGRLGSVRRVVQKDEESTHLLLFRWVMRHMVPVVPLLEISVATVGIAIERWPGDLDCSGRAGWLNQRLWHGGA